MSVKIHHGAPGSYKTSGAVWDDFVEAAFDGRLVITNVRGLSSPDRVRAVLAKEFPKREVPESFDIEWVDTETEDGIFAIQTFFHWADCGAFLLFDEAQLFWPSEMRPSDYAAFDFPTGKSFENGRPVIHSNVDMAGFHGRPRDYNDAWTRHRHFNWDIVLTSPDISLFHKKIRAVSEGAFLHQNQAIVGLPGRFLEGFHVASNNGRASDLMTVRGRKIPKWVFELYESTSTGVVSDTKAGLPFWKNPKIVGLTVFLFLLLALLASRGNPLNIFRPKRTAAAVPVTPAAHPGSPAPGQKVGSDPGRADDNPFSELKSKSLWLVGSQSFSVGSRVMTSFLFELQGDDESAGSVITSETLSRLGYSITQISRNLVSLRKDGKEYFIRARGVQSDKKSVL